MKSQSRTPFVLSVIRRVTLFYLKNISRQKSRFKKSFVDIESTQRAVLEEILNKMSETKYLSDLKIKEKSNYEDFARLAPVVRYEDLKDRIDRQLEQRTAELWNEDYLFYEWTSGSSGSRKRIPYTRSLKKSFSHLFEIWLQDLLENLELKSGKTYFSVSPMSFSENLGIQDDFDYIQGPLKYVIKFFSAVPPEIKRVRNPFEFKRVTAAYLLAERNLEIISIWSPSFLLQLLEFITENKELLKNDLQAGEIKNQFGTFKLPKTSKLQAQQLFNEKLEWSRIWPELKLVSCWGDGSSAILYQKLIEKIPNVHFQAKGLLSTEAPLTVPLQNGIGQRPLPAEVFYEFRDPSGRIYPLWLAPRDQNYELIITQKSGLLRYALGDRVHLGHNFELKFLGRLLVTDLVGEKLNEEFLTMALAPIQKQLGFFIFIPDITNCRYYLAAEQAVEPRLLVEIETLLRSNPHYALARDLNQLKPIQCLHLHGLLHKYESYFAAKGLKLGDIKVQHLFTNIAEVAPFLEELGVNLGSCF